MACVVRVEGKVDDVYLIPLNKHFIRQFPFFDSATGVKHSGNTSQG
jgi:hypothetical protein